MQLAESTGRPAKFCRQALLQAGGDEAAAKVLMDDPKFVRLHMDVDLGSLMKAAADPALFTREVSRTLSEHGGLSVEATRESEAQAERRTKVEIEEQEAAEARAEAARYRGESLITDEVFGILHHDTLWVGEVEAPGFADPLELTVDGSRGFNTPDGAPTERQRASWLRVAALGPGGLRDAIERASFDHYRSVAEDYRTYLDPEEVDEAVPRLTRSSQIWALFDGDPDVGVAADSPDSPVRVSIGFSCTWDEEHGHYVHFENGVVVAAGHLDS